MNRGLLLRPRYLASMAIGKVAIDMWLSRGPLKWLNDGQSL